MSAFGADNVYFEVQKNGLAAQDKLQRGDRPDRPRARAAAGRHRRRPLPAPRGLPPPRGAAVRADQVDAQPAEDQLRDQRVLPALQPRRWPTAFAEWPEAIATTLEIAERCDVELELGRQLIPRYPTPGRQRRGRVPARARATRGCAARYGDPIPAEALRARRLRARRDRPDGLQRLLPDRLGLRQVRQGRRASPSARAAARPPARSSPTACRSPTSIRCATTCCSSASSTPSACRCRTSTSTSRCAAASA